MSSGPVSRDGLVVIGASAGGVEALVRLVGQLPPDLPAAVLVVLHMGPDARSSLAAILQRAGALRACEAVDGMALEPGVILTAPPDHHLTVQDGSVGVNRGPRVNVHRPSVDVLFRSAAAQYGSRACGIVLSGALDDGTSGMRAIRHARGTTVVQEPTDAIFPSMPASVLDVLTPDHVLSADDIGRQLGTILAMSSRKEETHVHREPVNGSRGEPQRAEPQRAETPPGSPSQFGCPDCGGVLWDIDNESDLPFQCRIGHAYSVQSLNAAQQTRLEDALWAAVRTLEEQESLARTLLAKSPAGADDVSRHRLAHRLSEAHDRADVVRGFLVTSLPADLNGGPQD